MWLEVNGDGRIVGVHTVQCDSPNQWVETDDAEVMPGDEYKKGNIIRASEKITRAQKKEMERSERQRIAYSVITQRYPEWQQLNLLREGDADKIKVMGGFIDSVRDWSNAPRAGEDKLNQIIDDFFPTP